MYNLEPINLSREKDNNLFLTLLLEAYWWHLCENTSRTPSPLERDVLYGRPKGLAQGPYVAARVGVEPTTLRLKVIVSIKAPPRPTIIYI